MMYKRFGRRLFGVNLGHVILVECLVDMKDSAVNYASLIFHEIAREWAGYYASFGYFSEPLATFMQMGAYGRWNPGDYLSWLDQNEYTTLKYGGDVPFYEVVRDPMKYPRSILTLYWKGAFMLRSLRFIVGDETFNKALHDVLGECHGSSCNYTEFIRTIENVSGENLSWFFDEWFNSTLFPDYNITSLSISPAEDGYNMTFTIVDASNFTMPVPVRIYLDDGGYVDRTIWVEGTATVSLELPSRPVRIVIDPDEVMANINRKLEVGEVEVDVN